MQAGFIFVPRLVGSAAKSTGVDLAFCGRASNCASSRSDARRRGLGEMDDGIGHFRDPRTTGSAHGRQRAASAIPAEPPPGTALPLSPGRVRKATSPPPPGYLPFIDSPFVKPPFISPPYAKERLILIGSIPPSYTKNPDTAVRIFCIAKSPIELVAPAPQRASARRQVTDPPDKTAPNRPYPYSFPIDTNISLSGGRKGADAGYFVRRGMGLVTASGGQRTFGPLDSLLRSRGVRFVLCEVTPCTKWAGHAVFGAPGLFLYALLFAASISARRFS